MKQHYSLLALGMLFVSVLVASNVVACKLMVVELPSWLGGGSLQADCALFLFPLTYVISDIINEVYGFRTNRVVIWGGMLCTIAFSALVYWSILATPSPYWQHQEAYAVTLSSSIRIFVASLVAYFLGEFLNALVFDRIRRRAVRHGFVFRALMSTFLGNIFDTTAFCMIAFMRDLPSVELIKMVIVNVFAKSSVELFLMPLIIKVVHYCRVEAAQEQKERKILA